MLTTLFSQLQAVQRDALQRWTHAVSDTDTAPSLPAANLDTWRRIALAALQTSQHYSTAWRSALDAGWREQRDRLALDGSANALRSLATLQADLAARAGEARAQHANAMAASAAQYLQDLNQARDATDIALALTRLATDNQAHSREHGLQLAALAGGLQPALAQWTERALSHARAPETTSSE
ncbi:hypothetical protein [Ralstonia flaminis]|jgi:hypothetical protein|uniref:Poly(3-hydroxyalkanoate) polymerase subunit PhaE n=1 Tax=Ralstonia flaminis TaxID=3058597 RepID=A0ABM9KCE7_9RALS|nr:hypothetical protein [Ralstonia sp. LMG 18101]CAJ0821625.1 hypothetical protein LMG18101_04687 [Ralstonia sp. LMG 18101]